MFKLHFDRGFLALCGLMIAFALIVLVSTAQAQNTLQSFVGRTVSNVTRLDRAGSTVTVTSYDAALGPNGDTNWNPPPGQRRIVYRLEGGTGWDCPDEPGADAGVFCSAWITEPINSTVTNVISHIPISGLPAGSWCFREKSRDAASHVGSLIGLTAADGGPDGSCCVTVP